MAMNLLQPQPGGAINLLAPQDDSVPWYQYLASKGLAGIANAGQALGEAANLEMDPSAKSDLKPGEITARANQAAFGNPNPQPSSPWLKPIGAGIEALTSGGPLGVINPALALGTFGSGAGSEAAGQGM